ncbi:hypothetical protein D1007_35429 [Hordeum vulgare]|nr:hypothetical protein D1007_35429 [Hordeum vulgare]
MASSSGAPRRGGGTGKASVDLEAAMRNLKLKEAELDGVMVDDEEISRFSEETRWLVVAKVHTTKPFSAESFKTTMMFVWRLAYDPGIREADDNLFIILMFYVGDWNRVMHQGPWIFRGLMVVIEEYDGKGKPHTVALDRVQVRAHIHDTPELYRREGILDQLARRIGQVKSVEMNPNRFFEGNYVRVRVKIKIDEPLVRFTPLKIRGEEALLLAVKYEKVGFFCEVCGVMGHVLEECGDGVHGPDEVQYGQWMVAIRRSLAANQYPQHSSNPPRTRGRRGRGGGPQGQATSNSRTENAAKKRCSPEARMSEDENMEDTTESPMKPMQMEQDEGEPPRLNLLQKRGWTCPMLLQQGQQI